MLHCIAVKAVETFRVHYSVAMKIVMVILVRRFRVHCIAMKPEKAIRVHCIAMKAVKSFRVHCLAMKAVKDFGVNCIAIKAIKI